jgi:hypothetical protein
MRDWSVNGNYLEHELDGWQIRLPFEVRDGEVTIRGITVTPTAEAPPTLTKRFLNGIPFETALPAARAAVERAATRRLRPGDLSAMLKWAPRRPGRRGRPDLFYAGFAWRYVMLLGDGSTNPVRDLAAELRAFGHDYTDTQVRDYIAEARRRGLLTKSGRGRSGGQLTERGEHVWMEEE